MTKKALIILADGFEETEGIATIDILRRAGIAVTVAGLTDTTVISSHKIKIIAETSLQNIHGDFDALILPGGSQGSENLHRSELVTALIKNMHTSGKIIAAICAAPATILAPIGILDTKTATCYPGMEDAFPPSTTFKPARVVIDGPLITSRAAGTTCEFALAIVEKLIGKEPAQKVRDSILAL
ncbi:MAG TPA: DJ-1/PfpI family protein [Candidatus Omnitrophota bacterium]|nr:DJ-1/PfpI family protein [Candidatus Omnitrophota bacterium]HPT06913.1 DJ-1/PfpI family protein [Candidatus Omnitrophota bacterium]